VQPGERGAARALAMMHGHESSRPACCFATHDNAFTTDVDSRGNAGAIPDVITATLLAPAGISPGAVSRRTVLGRSHGASADRRASTREGGFMHRVRLTFIACALVVLPAAASAQIGVTPRFGIHIPAGEFGEFEDATDTIELEKEASLTLGATLDLGRFYAGFDYVTGATLTEDGVDGEDEVGNGSLAAAAAGFRFSLGLPLIQPHVRLGAGVKRLDFSFDDDPLDEIDDETQVALHGAIGATLGLGGLGITAELADYVTVDGFEPNDFMLTLGLRLGF
jgi:hypothetical protein